MTQRRRCGEARLAGMDLPFIFGRNTAEVEDFDFEIGSFLENLLGQLNHPVTLR